MADVASDFAGLGSPNAAPTPAPSESEVALLWAAASPWPDPGLVAEHARGARLGLVLEAAARHRVALLVLRGLETAGIVVEKQNSDVIGLAKLWEAHTRVALPAAAEAALAPLAAAGLTPLALKGVAIVGRYPATWLRPMDDIDLLIPRSSVRQAASVLEQAGWRRATHRGPDPRYDFLFQHPGVPGVALELHYEFARWRERPQGLDARRLWDERIPIDVFGTAAWGLSPELELIALIAHAAKRYHLFNRLIWAADIAVIARTSDLDWHKVAVLASNVRRRRALAVGLRLAERLGADVPDELLVLPRGVTRTGALDPLLDPARPFFPSTGRQPRHAYALIDDVMGKLRLAAGDLARPSAPKTHTRVVRELAWVVGGGIRRAIKTRSQ